LDIFKGDAMPQFSSEFMLSQVFWLFWVFLLLYVFVSRYFFPKIGNVVDMRSRKIAEDLEFSDAVVAKYKVMRAEAAEILAKAKSDAFAFVEKVAKDVEHKIADASAEIDRDISRHVAGEEERMFRLRASIHADLPVIVRDLKIIILEKLVR
jgi:F-type H+-transporting ATPase subunit b